MRHILFPLTSLVAFGSMVVACSSGGGGGGGGGPDPAAADGGSGDGGGTVVTTGDAAADANVAPVEWDKKLSGVPVDGVVATPAGEVFIVGGFPFTTSFTTDFGGGKVTPKANETTFLAKYDAKGALAWLKLFTGAEKMTQSWAIGLDGAGGVYLGGVVSASMSFGGSSIPLGFSQMGSMEAVLAHFDGTGKHLESTAVLDCLSECTAPMLVSNAKGLAFNVASANDVQTPFVMGGTQDYYRGGGAMQLTQVGGAAHVARLSGGIFGLAQDADGNVYNGTLQSSWAQVIVNDAQSTHVGDWDYFDIAPAYALATDGKSSVFLSGLSMKATTPVNHQFYQAVGSDIQWTADVNAPPADSELRPNGGTAVYDPASKTSVFALEFLGSISVGTTTFSTKGAGDYDVAVVRFDQKGKLVGHKQLGQTAHAEVVKSLAVLPGGRVVVAGDGDGVSLLTAFVL